jgi:hypothetical protein
MSGDCAQDAAATLEYLSLRQASDQNHGAREIVTLNGLPAVAWAGNASTPLAELGIAPGQWFQIMQPDGMRRLRLSGMLGDGRYLVFMDFTGARALRLGAEEFANLLRSKEAAPLDTQQTFSRALVQTTERQTAVLAEQETKRAEKQHKQTHTESLEADQRARARAAASQRLREAEERIRGHASPTPIAQQVGDSDRAVSAEQPFDRRTVARVAVRDLEKDSYIFTNRDGIKLRELTVPQLVTLIERDMVDILEHKTSFRETLSGGTDRLGQSPHSPA